MWRIDAAGPARLVAGRPPALPSGCFPAGPPAAISLPPPCRRPATRPPTGPASANTSPSTPSVTASPRTCWKTARISASFRPCSVISASIPPRTTRLSRSRSSPAPKVPWITCRPVKNWAAGPRPKSHSRPPQSLQRRSKHAPANSRVGRHLSTTRRRLPADACLAPASASPHAGHRELPHRRAGWRRRMVRPLPKHAHRLSLLPGPALSQVPGLARERWIQQRLAELLPVEYFHVVFTVPEQIAAIAFYNKEVVYQSCSALCGHSAYHRPRP
jgi:hypothetical protein